MLPLYENVLVLCTTLAHQPGQIVSFGAHRMIITEDDIRKLVRDRRGWVIISQPCWYLEIIVDPNVNEQRKNNKGKEVRPVEASANNCKSELYGINILII